MQNKFYAVTGKAPFTADRPIKDNTICPTRFNKLKEIAAAKGINIYDFMSVANIGTREELERHFNGDPSVINVLKLLKFMGIEEDKYKEILGLYV